MAYGCEGGSELDACTPARLGTCTATAGALVGLPLLVPGSFGVDNEDRESPLAVAGERQEEPPISVGFALLAGQTVLVGSMVISAMVDLVCSISAMVNIVCLILGRGHLIWTQGWELANVYAKKAYTNVDMSRVELFFSLPTGMEPETKLKGGKASV
jgi:hypothetical protein